MKRGLTDIINVMRGSTQVTKVMRGTVLIWEKAVGGYDADYQAVLDYATANAIVLPTGVQQDIDNQLMIDYKATGAWNKNDSVFKFEGTADPAFKLIDWKRLILGATFGSVTWDVDGIKGMVQMLISIHILTLHFTGLITQRQTLQLCLRKQLLDWAIELFSGCMKEILILIVYHS